MCSHVFKRRNTGLSTGGDTYDNGVPIVVSGRESLLRGEGEQVMCDSENREVREMRDAVTVLSIIHERGKQGLPLEDLYRQRYNPGLYLMAYGRIYQIWTARPLIPLHTLLSTLVHILTKKRECFV